MRKVAVSRVKLSILKGRYKELYCNLRMAFTAERTSLHKCWAPSGRLISLESPDPHCRLSWWHSYSVWPHVTCGCIDLCISLFPARRCFLRISSELCKSTRESQQNNTYLWHFIFLKITMETPQRVTFQDLDELFQDPGPQCPFVTEERQLLPAAWSLIPYSELSLEWNYFRSLC